MHTHTYMHAHIYTHTRICTHACTDTCRYARTHTYRVRQKRSWRLWWFNISWFWKPVTTGGVQRALSHDQTHRMTSSLLKDKQPLLYTSFLCYPTWPGTWTEADSNCWWLLKTGHGTKLVMVLIQTDTKLSTAQFFTIWGWLWSGVFSKLIKANIKITMNTK